MDKNYLVKSLKVLPGLMICGLGTYFVINASSVGIGAWETFQTGLALRTGLSFGACTVLVSFGLIALDILLKGKIGIGTVMNAVIIGSTVDFIKSYLDFLPEAASVPVGLVYLIIGQFILSAGLVLYMRPGLGCGPRDTLMVVIGNKFPNAKIGVVRFFLDCAVFSAGVLLGAPYGIGTIVAMGSFSFVLQLVCRILKFEPREVHHESLGDVYRKFKERSQPL